MFNLLSKINALNSIVFWWLNIWFCTWIGHVCFNEYKHIVVHEFTAVVFDFTIIKCNSCYRLMVGILPMWPLNTATRKVPTQGYKTALRFPLQFWRWVVLFGEHANTLSPFKWEAAIIFQVNVTSLVQWHKVVICICFRVFV